MVDDNRERPDVADRPDAIAESSDGLRPTRRRLLQGTAAATVAASFGGLAVGQDDGLDPAETIVLGGQVEGWQGREPPSIEGETNPTLNLQVGETYDLTWVNVDGLPHNFVITDPEGSVLTRTEIMSEQGAEQSVSFTVTEAMATYLCEVHPNSMRGAIQTGEAPAEQAAAIAEVPQGPEVGVQKIAGDPITQPVGMETVTIEGAERQYVVDQTGEIYLVTEDGVREFLDISPRLLVRNEGFDERGLLGMALHPNFADNRKFYVRYSSTPRGDAELPEDYDHMFVLSEFQSNEAFTEADPESERVLLQIPEPQFNHNAGDLAFGPDGLLYVTTGDGGGADDTGIGHVADWYETNRGGNGQDVTENLLGSILRIDVDGREDDKPYGIPADNPLVDTEGLDEQYAWGFRNPWRFSFNDGQLVVADVGQNLWEEVSVVERGGNYGWNVREGSHCFSTEQPSNPEAITECPTNAPDEPPYDGQPLTDPVLEYPHSVGNAIVGISVTGGYVYQGDAIGPLSGSYVFGDWSAGFRRPMGRLWVADLPQVSVDAEPADGDADNETVTNETVTNETVDATENVTENATKNATDSSLDFDLQSNETNVTGNETGNETNVTDVKTGNETNVTGNETNVTDVKTGNETNVTGNETNVTDTDGEQPEVEFPMRELVVAGSEDGRLNRTVLAFGRDDAGELYVLTSTTTTIDGTGEVFKIVPPGEGDEITPPGGGAEQGS